MGDPHRHVRLGARQVLNLIGDQQVQLDIGIAVAKARKYRQQHAMGKTGRRGRAHPARCLAVQPLHPAARTDDRGLGSFGHRQQLVTRRVQRQARARAFKQPHTVGAFKRTQVAVGSGMGAERRCDLSDGKNHLLERVTAYIPEERLGIDIYEFYRADQGCQFGD